MIDTKKCPHCGREVHKDAQYCMYCMTSLLPKKDITPKVSRRFGWLTACVILFALGVLTVSFFFLFNRLNATGGEPGVNTNQNLQQSTIAEEGTSTHRDKPISSDTAQDTTAATEGMLTDPLCTTQTESNRETTTPTVEEPESTQAKTTEPTQAQPSTSPVIPQTAPPTLQLCNHYYMPADCLKPMTCAYCGDTYGGPDPDGHQWQPCTAVVHHNEVGHYEEKEVYYKKTVYLCFFCGYNQDGFDSMEAVLEHTPIHSQAALYDYLLSKLDSLTETREEWATRTESQWVVDVEAYDENTLIGYVCTLCNQQKDP